jgi:hypothetical protein
MGIRDLDISTGQSIIQMNKRESRLVFRAVSKCADTASWQNARVNLETG